MDADFTDFMDADLTSRNYRSYIHVLRIVSSDGLHACSLCAYKKLPFVFIEQDFTSEGVCYHVRVRFHCSVILAYVSLSH